ncbi:hypothetical protein [Flavobacterium sp. XGLA_31]|uniref:hypothetical protein n=1 Tax=Flavobacterium sp. XGLA_31 TaxID=3447666 RepID=UPI003F2BC527
MKSKTTSSDSLLDMGNKQPKNSFKKMCHINLVQIVIAVILISNAVFAANRTNTQGHSKGQFPSARFATTSGTNPLKKPAATIDSDNPVSIAAYKKTMEEIIAEDHKIIESNLESVTPTGAESMNTANNQIIESSNRKEAFPFHSDSLKGATPEFQ